MWRYGDAIVAQLLLQHRNRWSGITLLALRDRDAGIEVGWGTASRIPTQRTADIAGIARI
jgi:hypothetical protein